MGRTVTKVKISYSDGKSFVIHNDGTIDGVSWDKGALPPVLGPQLTAAERKALFKPDTLPPSGGPPIDDDQCILVGGFWRCC